MSKGSRWELHDVTDAIVGDVPANRAAVEDSLVAGAVVAFAVAGGMVAGEVVAAAFVPPAPAGTGVSLAAPLAEEAAHSIRRAIAAIRPHPEVRRRTVGGAAWIRGRGMLRRVADFMGFFPYLESHA